MAVVGVAWADTGTITFSGSGVKINGANVTGDDNLGNTWTITTEGTTSFTSNTAYYQVGSSKSPATSITFTTTLSEDVNIESMSAKFGGFNGTAGTITLKVGETEIGTGSLNAANDVTVNSNSTAVGKVLTITVTGISKGVKVYNISYTYSAASGDTPSISASNVNIDYDVTGGEISYTINNGVDGGVLNASVTDGDWLTLSGTNFESPIAFTCDANTVNAARTATVTLTYSYGNNETVTKDVIVTQAAAPVIYTTIPELFAAATSTATDVNVQFNNWVVTGVSTNGKNVFVTDGTNGFAIYDGSGSLASTYAVGNTLAGLASCKLKLQNGYAQLQDVNAADLTIGTGGSVDFATITMADLAGVNTGALVQYDNLTCSVDDSGTTPKYYLTDGTTTLQVYNSLYADAYSTLVDGKTYNIKGVYQQYNNTKEILPRSTEDIVEVVSEEPSITVSPAEVNATAEETDGTLAISYENLEISDVTDFEVQYYDVTGAPISSEPEWVAVEVTVGTAGYEVSYIIENNTNSEERTAYFKVMALDNDANEVYSNLVTVTQEGFSSTGSFTFEQTSATDGTLTNEPEGVTAVFNNTYTNNKEQLTKDNSMTLTIKGMPANYKVTGITLTVKNNASKGNGTATVSIGKKEIGTFNVTGLGNTYGDQIVTITPSFATSDLIINIAATENSVYCKKFTIEYEIMDYVGVTIKEGFTATTFSCDKALDFSNVEGITAFIITDDKGATAQVWKVPAGKGLYIVGAEGNYEVPFLADETEAEDVSANKLIPTDGTTEFKSDESTTYYAFGKQNGKEAFYKVPTSGYTPSANKAVLVVNAPASSAKEMIVIGGDVTGIESIENGTIVNDNYYTIDGKLVKGQPTQKGIYIVGGRKVVIK